MLNWTRSIFEICYGFR